jgi:MYXO-CTERM domain-containing protein
MRRLLAVSSLCLLFVPAAVLLQPREAAACSCIPSPGPVEAAQSVDLVFHAKLVSVADAPKGGNFDIPSKAFTFAVIRSFKGDDLSGVEVNVISADNSAACGRGFGKPGEEWLIYARRDDDGTIHDNLCSRSMPIAQASDDIAELEANADRLDDDPPEPEYPEDPGPADPEPDPIPFGDPVDTGDDEDESNTSGEQPEPTAKPGRCTVTEDTPAGGLAGFLTLALGFVALRRRR